MWNGLQQLEKLYRAGISPQRNQTPGSSQRDEKTPGSSQIDEKTPGSSKSDSSPSSGLFNLSLGNSPSSSNESSEPKKRRIERGTERRLEFPEDVRPEFPEEVESPVKHGYYIDDKTGLINKDKYEEFIKIFSDAIEGEGINIQTTFTAPKEAERYWFETNMLIPKYPKKEIFFEFDDNYYQGTLTSQEILEYYINNLNDVSKSFSVKIQNLNNDSKLVFFTNTSSPF